MAIGSMDVWPEMGKFSALTDPKTYSSLRQYREDSVMTPTRSIYEVTDVEELQAALNTAANTLRIGIAAATAEIRQIDENTSPRYIVSCVHNMIDDCLKAVGDFEALQALIEERARAIEEQGKSSMYSSIIPLALSEDDLFEGAEIFTVGYGRRQHFSENTVATILPDRHYSEEVRADSLVFLNEEGKRTYCSNLGIPSHRNKDEKLWSEEYVSFFSSAETRRLVADWLLLLDFSGSAPSAYHMARAHPEDYPTELFIMDGRIGIRRADS